MTVDYVVITLVTTGLQRPGEVMESDGSLKSHRIKSVMEKSWKIGGHVGKLERLTLVGLLCCSEDM